MKRLNQLLLALLGTIFLAGCRESTSVLSLAGEWEFAIDSTDIGIAKHWYSQSFPDKIKLPGTMDDAGYGTPNQLLPSVSKPQILHLTRKHSYIGPAWYIREISIPSDWKEKNIELKLERVIWQTNVWIDGKEVNGEQESLISPHCFDLTEYLSPGKHRIAIRVDNRKKYDITAGDMAHAYTNETQIMWNGILGDISLRAKDAVFMKDIQIYPDIQTREIHVKGKLQNTGNKASGTLTVHVKEKNTGKSVTEIEQQMDLSAGETMLDFVCPMGENVRLWSEFTPIMYELEIKMKTKESLAQEKIEFGMRQIGRNGADLLVNGKKVFLRGTLECCIFPLTGYPPTTKEGWSKVFRSAKEWGLNHLRFHSWCPPKAAFEVADSLGFYLQVELPLWSLNVGENPAMNQFLYDEAKRILSEYGNHPSFCFLSLGNELQPDFVFLGGLLDTVKALDSRHLYTTTSFTFERGHGNWPEPHDDFFITQWTKKGWVRGQGVFDVEMPNFNKDYSASVDSMPVPVITHEIGQYAVYPDLKEIAKYTGVLEPLNFKGIKQELENKNLLEKADDYLSASGRLAAILYKEEIERAMKTRGISGFQLLDLHDFPGQGTALVGLLNAFWESKGVANATDFRQFSAPVVPLARFPKAVYKNNELFTASIEVANYSSEEINNKNIKWTLTGQSGQSLKEGIFPLANIKIGGGNIIGEISCSLSEVTKAEQLKLTASIDGSNYKNTWNIWVYPATLTIEKEDIIVTDKLTETQKALAAGKTVLFNPPYQMCAGLQGKFVPVFWSPVHFPKQAGTMGLLLDPDHQAFTHFPTEGHTNWQWWSLTTQSRTLVIDSIYQHVTPLVECIDNFANNRRLTTLFETNCLNGKLIVCSMDLLNRQDIFPEKKQLLYSLISYMKSDAFVPVKSISFEDLCSLVTPNTKTDKKETPQSVY